MPGGSPPVWNVPSGRICAPFMLKPMPITSSLRGATISIAPTNGSPALVVTRPLMRPSRAETSANETLVTSCPARTVTRRASARLRCPGSRSRRSHRTARSAAPAFMRHELHVPERGGNVVLAWWQAEEAELSEVVGAIVAALRAAPVTSRRDPPMYA